LVENKNSERTLKSRQKNKEAYNAYMRRWVSSETGREKKRGYRYKTAYGITLEEYNRLLLSQQGVCGICFLPEVFLNKEGQPKHLVVDHDHHTNKVRGLLCHTCNLLLGYCKDNKVLLANAIKYLTKHNL